jgi:dTDP-4-amino-4,6-dideoxygalactose transaminase
VTIPPGAHRRWPEITAADRAALARVLDRGVTWGPHAPETLALEEEWAGYVGTRFCLLVNSGTAALHCALAGVGIGPADEVIVPAFSFVATPMAVLQAGATPVFCDIDPATCTLDPAGVERLVGERTRALMPVHAHGLPADMDELRAIAARHGLAVIEDAAQAHGATYRGVRTGALADGGAFSLNGSKHLSAGEGGLLVTNDERAARSARRLAIFGEDTPPTGPGRYRAYWSHGLGWNYRSHELTAALARSQLSRLDEHLEIGQRNAAILNAGLTGLPGLRPPYVPEDRTCAFYRYRLRIEPEQLGFDGPPLELRDRLLHALQGEGVAASLWQLLPLPAQPVFRNGGREPWDPTAHPETLRLLESSIVLGTADTPIFNQPAELMERYVEELETLLDPGNRDRLLTGPYRAVEPWPPIDEGRIAGLPT